MREKNGSKDVIFSHTSENGKHHQKSGKQPVLKKRRGEVLTIFFVDYLFTIPSVFIHYGIEFP